LAVTRRLRKALQTQGGAAIGQLLDELRKTTSNAEFLIQISRSLSETATDRHNGHPGETL
jgi:hypothetical protein